MCSLRSVLLYRIQFSIQQKKPFGTHRQAIRRTRGSSEIDMLWANLFLHTAIVRNLCKSHVQGRSSDSGISILFRLPSKLQWHSEIKLLLYSGVTVQAFHLTFLFSCKQAPWTLNSAFIVTYYLILSISCTEKNSVLRWKNSAKTKDLGDGRKNEYFHGGNWL